VCEEEHQDEGVFLLSVNFVDRFLTSVQTKKSMLQLLGCACMFIASKMHDNTTPLRSNKLVMYTDYSITASQLLVRLEHKGQCWGVTGCKSNTLQLTRYYFE